MRVKNIKHISLSKAWATLDRIDFDYRFKDGTWKRISRETYNRGNGAAILLYNKTQQTVILTRQFRMPIYEENPAEAMSVEVCAGAIDHKEDAVLTIVREVEEETGYRIDTAEHVLTAYTSPGALTEKMYLFVAQYDKCLKVSDGGGLESEDEELDVLEISFKNVKEMLAQNEIKDAKTIMLIQYAQIHGLIQ
jgi:GDP-mannose pyrophosphatase NudK